MFDVGSREDGCFRLRVAAVRWWPRIRRQLVMAYKPVFPQKVLSADIYSG